MKNGITIAAVGLFFAASNASAMLLNDFNVIVSNDLIMPSQEIEGRVIVGNDILVQGATQIAFDGSALAPLSQSDYGTFQLEQQDGVIVGNDITGNNTLNLTTNNPNVMVGGAIVDTTINTSGTVTAGDTDVPFIIQQAQQEVANLGNYLDSLSANSQFNYSDPNQITTFSTPTSDSYGNLVSVFDVGTDFFSLQNGTPLAWTTDQANFDSTDLFVFKVAGGSLDTELNININNANFNDDLFQSRIIWDFSAYAGETLTFTTGLGGALFAPGADVTMGTPLEGLVIAENLTIGAEVHMPYLDFSVPDLGSEDPPSGVPEPGTMLLFGAGLCALSGGLRRQQKR